MDVYSSVEVGSDPGVHQIFGRPSQSGSAFTVISHKYTHCALYILCFCCYSLMSSKLYTRAVMLEYSFIHDSICGID